jgi:phosphate-selective porin
MGGSAMKRISLVFLALLAMGVSAHAQIQGPGGCTALAPCTVITAPAPTAPTTQSPGTITTGGTFQQVFAANSSRTACGIQNTSNHTGYVYWFSGTATTANALEIAPGQPFYCQGPGGSVVKTAIQYTTSTTGDTFAYWENQ